MKRVAWSACVVIAAFAVIAPLSAETIDRVLAVVAGQVITLSDVTAARDLGLVEDGSPDPIRTTLLRLIDRQLVLAEVDRYAPPEPPEDVIMRELRRVRARFSTQASYNEALARSGMDEPRLRQSLRDDLRIRAYLELRFVVPNASDEEVGRFYREHADRFTRAGQLAPLDAVSAEIQQSLAAERRQMLVNDWIAGLRRRAIITNLYAANP
jgi:hypothetical protein